MVKWALLWGDEGTTSEHEATMTIDRRCDSAQDHLAFRAELEEAIQSGGDASELAVLHLRLGHLLRNQFLEGVTALKHFQEAFKLDGERLDASSRPE